MPDPVTGVIAGTGLLGAGVQATSASGAARAQQRAADASVAEQRRQFDQVRQLLNPYVQAGTPALQGLMDIAGVGGARGTDWAAYVNANPDALANWNSLTPEQKAQFGNNIAAFGEYHWQEDGARRDISQFGGQDAQQAAINRLEQSPIFQSLARQGEEAILQNASATGGLRGGNTQGALARFRPALLNQFIEQQYGRMAGLASIGQNAAAGVGNAGMATGNNISNALMASGQAQAAGIGAQGQIFGNAIGNIGGAFAGALRPAAAPMASLLPSVNDTINRNRDIF